MSEPKDIPFDGWQRVAEVRLDTILLRDAEILALLNSNVELNAQLSDARAENARLRLAEGLGAAT